MLLIHLSRCVQEFDKIVFKTIFIIDINHLYTGEADEIYYKKSLPFSSDSNSYTLSAPLKPSWTHGSQGFL